jgi:hypothetical protein
MAEGRKKPSLISYFSFKCIIPYRNYLSDVIIMYVCQEINILNYIKFLNRGVCNIFTINNCYFIFSKNININIIFLRNV